MPLTPYQRSAGTYVKSGWSPIPMTVANAAGDKGQPLAGVTGRDGIVVDRDNVEGFVFGAGASSHPNVSVRAHGWVGFDVDQYNGKCGVAQLAEVEEDLGPLPDTYRSTARGFDSGSGIRFYRIPVGLLVNAEGSNFATYGDSIEIIRFEHRYAKCWPTIHPNGELYRWFSADGFMLPEDTVPFVHNLPQLPEPWLDWLCRDNRVRPERATERRSGELRGDGDRVFPDEAAVRHFLAAHRQRLVTTPAGSGFNQALNDYAHALSAFVPEFFTEEQATELCHDAIRTGVNGWATANSSSRATIRSGLIRSRQPFYARRPTAVELSDPFNNYFEGPVLAAAPKAVAPSWLVPKPRQDDDADLGVSPSERFKTGRTCDSTGRVPNEPLDALFSDAAFPMFGHIRQFARARGVSPIAVLGVVLTRISAALPTYMVAPPLVGGHGSLNAFLCLIGRAGMSKGGATKAAECAVEITMEHMANGVLAQVDPNPGPIYAPKIGSGQGVAAQFCHRRKPHAQTGDPGALIRDRDAVLFTCQEVSDLTAKAAGTSTLLSTICEMWVAEPLGSSYVDPTKRLPVEGMSYRACFLLHAQPDLMAPLLVDAAPTGAPQRFLYLPVVDSWRPDDRPDAPAPLRWTPPGATRTGNYAEVPVCEKARNAILDHNAMMHEGLADPLDGHILFATLKTAVAINASRGRVGVDDASWGYAVLLHELSRNTRTAVINYLREQKRSSHQEAAKIEAHKATIVTEIVKEASESQEFAKSRARIIEVLTDAPVYTLTKAKIQQRCSRKWDAEAFDKLCVEKVLTWKTVPSGAARGRQEVTVYALTENR